MAMITLEYYGYLVEVEYELTDDSIDILDWRFESEEIAEELNLHNAHAKAVFEGELVQMIGEHENRQKEAQKWIKPYMGHKYNK